MKRFVLLITVLFLFSFVELANASVCGCYSPVSHYNNFALDQNTPIRTEFSCCKTVTAFFAGTGCTGQPYLPVTEGTVYIMDRNIRCPNNPVPIPTALLLLGSGLIGIVGFSRKQLFPIQ